MTTLWLLLPLLVHAAKTGAGGNKNRAIDATLSLQRRNSVGPYMLTGENFTIYATERPRPYHVGLFFTADQDRCSDCPGMLAEYADVASLFDEQYNISDAPTDQIVYFFVISLGDAPELFQSLGITFVPQLFVIGPKSKEDLRQPLSDFSIDLFQGKDLAESISERAGVQIRRLYNVATALVILVPMAVAAALVVTLAARDLGKAMFWYQSKVIWIPVCGMCFSVGVSGVISCVIRHADLLSYEGRSRAPFIFGDADDRTQNYTEGIIVAALTLFCGGAAFMVFVGSKLNIYIGRDVLVILSISAFIVAAANLYQAYAIETPYYDMQRLLPFGLWEWMNGPVKKSSGIAKRVHRLSLFILAECNSWEQFSKKVQALFVGYITRTYFPNSSK